MAEASTGSPDSAQVLASRPWTQVWTDALPVAPAWVGAAFAGGDVVLGALFLAVFAMDGTSGVPADEVLLSTVVFGLEIGFAIAALAYARRGYESTLRALLPSLSASEAELVELRQEVLGFRVWPQRRIGLASAAIAMFVTYFTTDLAERTGGPVMAWVLGQNAIASWLVVRTIAHDLRVSNALSRGTERLARVELLDLSPFAPLAARGLQSTLVIVLAISITSLLFGTGGDISPLLPVVQTGTVLLAAFALVLPSLGIRRRVRAAKQEELLRLSAEVRNLRATGSGAGGSGPDRESRLDTLLSLKHHVGAAREWPFDLGTLGRFALYAAIGVGSWLGGAAVERLLDLALG